jgi:hypothetical protein
MVSLLYGSSNVYCNFARALGLGLFAGRDLTHQKITLVNGFFHTETSGTNFIQ